MSFLNSVLGSIGKDGDRTGQPPPPVLPKRKAEDPIRRPHDKSCKATGTSRPSPAPNADNRRSDNKNQTDREAPENALAIPYRGTGKASISAPTSPVPATDVPKQHKKGSYKEIMARAQAASSQPKPVVGAISHKQKSKTELSHKRELKLKKKEVRDRKFGIAKEGSRPTSSDGGKGEGQMGNKRVGGKVAQQPTYKGTMKPKVETAYRGTAGRLASAKRDTKPAGRRNANAYAATDDELDSMQEEEEDDGHGYSEEESDDMEAGFTDVELEEKSAERIAKVEDEKEAAMEAKLKKEKERRKNLQELAKKAKPQRY
ncbi:uncharacterized protein KY384_004164 [Bacidia gigantensis]|uniref:uncharacterized protein n=1 Tax=Bacidia gigantensis TaxID=2732470 RepID=UPI001D0511D6|nr:uncharacterized protein KY384_004164 [Bacidia gigantensis]KAG8530807.1 hypothetical protein KY384_004164 [Bacidia gigantensis]